jgi:hypothetical protein
VPSMKILDSILDIFLRVCLAVGFALTIQEHRGP